MPVLNPAPLSDAPLAMALASLFVLWIVASALTTPSLARASGFSRREGLVLLGITLFGLALRALLPPLSPFHESYHGYPLLHNPPPFMHVDVAVLYPIVLRLLGLTDAKVLLFNLGLSGLNIVLTGLVARAFFKETAPALFAALAIAVLPLAVRMGPTASFFNLALTLFLFAAWQGLHALLRSSWKLMLLAALSAFLATTVRSMTVVLAPALLLILAGAGGARRWRLLAVAALSLLGSALQGGQMLMVTLSGQVRHLGHTEPPPAEHYPGIYSYPDVGPSLFAALGILGILAMLFERRVRWAGLALGLLIVALNLAGSSVYQTPRIYRHLLVASSVSCVAVGAGAWVLMRALAHVPRLPDRAGGILVALLLVAGVALTPGSLDFVRHRYAENIEFRFVQEQSATMPAGTAAGLSMSPHTRTGTFIHDYMEWRAKQRLVSHSDRNRHFLYLGIACSSQGGQEEGVVIRETRYGPLQAGCADALESGSWREFARIDVPKESYMGLDISPFRDPVPLVVLLEEREAK